MKLTKKVYGKLQVAIRHAISRCTNRFSENYDSYGGRGITVHPEWLLDRGAFLDYLATLPGHDDPALYLDRSDNNRGYEPGNLRWTTPSESSRNRRPRMAGCRRQVRPKQGDSPFRRIRVQARLTIGDVEAQLGVGHNTISRFELGDPTISPAMHARITDFYAGLERMLEARAAE
jgi:hypothetical protein